MKAILGFAFFVLFLAGIAFVMLQGKQLARPGGGGAEMTGITWKPISLAGESVPLDSGMFVKFDVDGSINGDGGCNGFFGSLQQGESGVEVGRLGATRKACPAAIMDREIALLDAVQNTRDFRSRGGNMSLLDGDGEVLAEFVAADDE